MTARSIVTKQLPRDTTRGPSYDGPLPIWTCPHCGQTNRMATLEIPRPIDVVDECPCGAVADLRYRFAHRGETGEGT